MSSVPDVKKVCLVGSNGTLGSVLLDGLIQAECFDVSILRRSNSSSSTETPPAALPFSTLSVSPDLTVDELAAALADQDAVIAAFPLKDVTQHLRLAEAAFRAGVRRYIPADFGSCDASDPQTQKHLRLYRDKTLVREKCEELAWRAEAEGAPFSWTAIVCGHFFDFGIRSGLLHFDLATQTADILDGGNMKASASTLRRVAEATVRVLQKSSLAETRNQAVYVQSFCPTQLEIFASLERVTGSKWHTRELESNAYLELSKQRLQGGDREAVEDVVFVLGTVDADWTRKEGFAMDLLGFEDEKLDEVVAEVVAAHTAAKASST